MDMSSCHIIPNENTKINKPAPACGTARRIKEVFLNHRGELRRVIEISMKIRQGIQAIDSFIQKATSAVCPRCARVCCVNEHSSYSCEDLIYLYALGFEPAGCGQTDPDVPCRFLSPEGCRIRRTLRPSGCNWYFCASLYEAMEKAPSRTYKDFDDSMFDLAELWMEMIREFLLESKNLTGYDIPVADLTTSSGLMPGV